MIHGVTDESPHDLKSRWLVQIQPHHNEAILSFLNRVANQFQIPLRDILKEITGQSKNPLLDLDVAPTDHSKVQLKRRFGFSDEIIEEMCIVGFVDDLGFSTRRQANGLTNYDGRTHVAWVMPSIRLFMQRHQALHGMGTPYCLFCHDQQGPFWYHRFTRLSFVTFCPVHNEPLLGRCLRCGNGTSALSLMPPKTWTDGANAIHCRYCQNSPIVEDHPDGDWSANREQLAQLRALQELSLGALTNGVVDIPEVGVVSSRTYFRGLRRILTHAFVPYHPLPVPNVSPVDVSGQYQRPMAFEYLPFWQRKARLSAAAWVLEHPVERWRMLRTLEAVDRHVPLKIEHPWDRIDQLCQKPR